MNHRECVSTSEAREVQNPADVAAKSTRQWLLLPSAADTPAASYMISGDNFSSLAEYRLRPENVGFFYAF